MALREPDALVFVAHRRVTTERIRPCRHGIEKLRVVDIAVGPVLYRVRRRPWRRVTTSVSSLCRDAWAQTGAQLSARPFGKIAWAVLDFNQ